MKEKRRYNSSNRLANPKPGQWENSPNWERALEKTNLTIAVSEALHALRSGEPQVAQAVLERVA